MSSSESGLSDTVDPMAIVSDDEIVLEPKIFTSEPESDLEMMSDDDDDFQPFALPNFGDDDHFILGHPDGEHVVVPILAPLPLAAFPLEDLPFDDLSDDDIDLFIDGPPDDAQGDGVLVEDVIVVPLVEISIIEVSSDHSVPDSFESVSSTALHAVGLRHYAPNTDDDTAMSAAPIPPHDVEPGLEHDFIPVDQPIDAPADPELVPADPEPIIPAPEPLPDQDPVPFGIPVVAPLIPDPIPAPTDPATFAITPPPTHAPVDVAPFPPIVSDVHHTDLPITFLQDIPAPRPGEGPSSQHPSHVPHVSAAFPHMPQYTPTTNFTSSPPGEPLIWFPPNTMPVSDPYHPSHFIGYTRDELVLSLQLQQEILCRRVMELERIPRPPPCSCPSPFATPPAPLLPYPDFDVRFLTMEQQISYLLRHVYDLEEELAHKMPPRRNNQLPITEAELQERISQAIAQHEALRSEHSGGCTNKQFLDCKPLNFDGTGGAVAFVRWVEKTDSVLRMSKCAPEHQVTYISGLFLDGALSLWNLQVQTRKLHML
ncbi:histone-lysine N-methyltransferase SETD1B-like [Helianthus annuus]|uniref:histone-lysine N-methyltransferase SETD1B-like n=1 Tax=Helianthus annuus TaxID=4232 RepID=UPI000B9035E0|nr:histone-lysine N-methyltransferase SETD1B-like [Helianthus annuus]